MERDALVYLGLLGDDLTMTMGLLWLGMRMANGI
jgi:hypothetical protein